MQSAAISYTSERDRLWIGPRCAEAAKLNTVPVREEDTSPADMTGLPVWDDVVRPCNGQLDLRRECPLGDCKPLTSPRVQHVQ